ncbi:hypothetical protein IAR50_004934 [Cryptococcus sp. DSM 104548]
MPPPSCLIQVDPTSGQAHIPLKDTQGFSLTPLGEEDLDDVINLYNRPETGQWACRRPYPYTEAHTAYFDFPAIAAALTSILSLLSLPSSNQDAQRGRASFVFNALRETSTGRVVGLVFTGPSDRTAPDNATDNGEVRGRGAEWEIAYDLLPEFWGKGLGKGMVQGALAYAKWAGVKRVCAFYQPENTASASLLAKVGFVKYGERQVEWPEEKGGGTRLCYECNVDL